MTRHIASVSTVREGPSLLVNALLSPRQPVSRCVKAQARGTGRPVTLFFQKNSEESDTPRHDLRVSLPIDAKSRILDKKKSILDFKKHIVDEKGVEIEINPERPPLQSLS